MDMYSVIYRIGYAIHV